MLTLYDHPASANGYKLRLLLAQLERPYRLENVDIFAGESRTGPFRLKNPDGRIPVLQLDGGECLAESNACLFWLAEGTALLPGSALGRARVLQWLFFEQNQVEPNLGTARYWKLTGRDARLLEVFAQKLGASSAALDTLEGFLAAHPFLVEDRYTIADLGLFAYTHLAADAGLPLQERPHLLSWLERVRSQPRFFEGLAPYPASAHAG